MSFFYLRPEVGGNVVTKSEVIDVTSRPMRIKKLHYVFDGWLGDPLVASVGNFILRTESVEPLRRLSPTGIEFDTAEVSASPEFLERQPTTQLPKFCWIKPTGVAGVDDFGYAPNGLLVVSERALNFFHDQGMKVGRINPFPGPDPLAHLIT